jgi:chromosome segregation ATPase
MIEWLDEERRRDKNTIAQLEERSAQQQELIEQLKRQLNGIESEMAGQRSQFMPADRDAELMERFRSEFEQIIEGMETKRLTAERELERRAEVAREALSAPIRKLEEEQSKTNEKIKDVLSARAERDRTSSAIVGLQQRVEDLSKKIEEPERRLVQLEEQRRQDNRRLSDVQTTLPDINKAMDQMASKFDLLEGLTKNNEKRIIDLQAGEGKRREDLQEFLDQQNLISQQRDMQVNELKSRVNTNDEDMRRNLERFESWAETHRQMRKVVDDFERIGERLERRINEVAEMQRLSEERFRTEWNDWAGEDQLRWKEFTVSNDESWRANHKDMQDLRAQLQDAMDVIQPMQRSVDRLWKLLRAQADMYRDRFQELLLEYDKAEDHAQPSPNGNN